eukprot:TRINITY_DN3417_c0_g3_i4.p1 TRINITY_DN3417_c0_g3~~TRINITY_DN3417_c0_g3_i4.p1  ORF type:complete len:394 (+),score=127.35 TRINITY_DN3417_c0_g3_i4:107-1288(+)
MKCSLVLLLVLVLLGAVGALHSVGRAPSVSLVDESSDSGEAWTDVDELADEECDSDKTASLSLKDSFSRTLVLSRFNFDPPLPAGGEITGLGLRIRRRQRYFLFGNNYALDMFVGLAILNDGNEAAFISQNAAVDGQYSKVFYRFDDYGGENVTWGIPVNFHPPSETTALLAALIKIRSEHINLAAPLPLDVTVDIDCVEVDVFYNAPDEAVPLPTTTTAAGRTNTPLVVSLPPETIFTGTRTAFVPFATESVPAGSETTSTVVAVSSSVAAAAATTTSVSTEPTGDSGGPVVLIIVVVLVACGLLLAVLVFLRVRKKSRSYDTSSSISLEDAGVEGYITDAIPPPQHFTNEQATYDIKKGAMAFLNTETQTMDVSSSSGGTTTFTPLSAAPE